MPMRKFRVRKSVLAAVAATGAIASTGFAVQGTAMAGTNGQHITFCTNADARSVEARGTNQDGVATVITVDMTANRDSRGCVPYDPNVWWKGPVHLTWHTTYDTPTETDCFVPEQSEADVVTCFDFDRRMPDLWGGDLPPA